MNFCCHLPYVQVCNIRKRILAPIERSRFRLQRKHTAYKYQEGIVMWVYGITIIGMTHDTQISVINIDVYYRSLVSIQYTLMVIS